MKKISHSAWQKYLTCPKMYDYHYNQRLRPAGTSSALLFGTAIDEALNDLLLHDKDPVPVFRKHFKEFDDKVAIHNLDIDMNILTDDQKKELAPQDDIYKAWACLRVKGRVLLEAYQEYFLPEVEEVVDVQKKLTSRPGVIDAIVKLRGHGKVLIDHKTATRPYNKESVSVSTQLALYAGDQKISKAGYVVLLKNIPKAKSCTNCGADGTGTRYKTCAQILEGKRCNGAWDYGVNKKRAIQTIISEVPGVNKDLFQDSIQQVEQMIDKKEFPRSLGSCQYIYGAPCPYINMCWKNDKTGLEEK